MSSSRKKSLVSVGASDTVEAAILIVEDSPDDYEACFAALTSDTSFSNPIVWLETREDALRYLRKEGEFATAVHDLPGIILLDLNLPGLDGCDVLERLKNDPDTRRVPVVMMTGSDEQADIDRCYDAGSNRYVVKAVNLDNLLIAISRFRNYWFEIALLPRLR
jgi:CheY-like chemotaxis protein